MFEARIRKLLSFFIYFFLSLLCVCVLGGGECSKLELENYFLSLFISFFLCCVCVCWGGGGLIYHHSMLRSLYNSRLFLFVYRPPAESDNPRNIANG